MLFRSLHLRTDRVEIEVHLGHDHVLELDRVIGREHRGPAAAILDDPELRDVGERIVAELLREPGVRLAVLLIGRAVTEVRV